MVAAARGASRTALVVVLLALVVVTAACGAADPAGTPPEGSSAPDGPCGTAVGEADETTRALVGLSEAEAVERAGASGLQVRVAGRGAECYPLTADHRTDRVNLTLDDAGAVRAAGRG